MFQCNSVGGRAASHPKHHSVPRGPSVLSSLGAPFWWIYIFCENPIARFDVIEFVGGGEGVGKGGVYGLALL